MATINVRQLDDDVVRRLKRRASVNNRSLEGEVRHILKSAVDDDMAAKRASFLAVEDRLRRKARLGEIERPETAAMTATVPEMPVPWEADETVCVDAIRLALALERPVYDCIYLALAHRLGAALVTADLRFADALASTEHGEAVVTLADYARTGC